MRVTYPLPALSELKASARPQLAPKPEPAVPAADKAAVGHSPSLPGVAGPVDLSYSVATEGVTVSQIERQSGRVLRKVEILSPPLRPVQPRTRAGHIIDLSA